MPADLTLLHLQRNLAQTDDPERRKALEARIAEREADPPEDDEPEAGDGLDDLKKADLLDLADGLDVSSANTKAEIIEALREDG